MTDSALGIHRGFGARGCVLVKAGGETATRIEDRCRLCNNCTKCMLVQCQEHQCADWVFVSDRVELCCKARKAMFLLAASTLSVMLLLSMQISCCTAVRSCLAPVRCSCCAGCVMWQPFLLVGKVQPFQ